MIDRIKKLREALNLSQTEFGKKLGLARNTIANYEGGSRTPNDAIIKLICNTFNVDYYWLTKGEGEMFNAIPSTTIDIICTEFSLDETDRIILESYLEATPEERIGIKHFLLSIANKTKKDEN